MPLFRNKKLKKALDELYLDIINEDILSYSQKNFYKLEEKIQELYKFDECVRILNTDKY